MSVEMLFPPDRPPAQDNMPLWRYMKLSTFFMLLEGKAFFPSVATLQKGDPLEGDLIPERGWLWARLNEVCGGDSTRLVEWLERKGEGWEPGFLRSNRDDGHLQGNILSRLYIGQLAKRRAVWCWFYALHESAGMWSVYGSGGIAVGTRLSKLISALPQNVQFQIAPITYANRSTPSALSYFNPEDVRNKELIHRPHLMKGLEYQHENEVRVTTMCLPTKPGRLIKDIKPVALIEDVVISPLLPFEEAKAVEAQIQKYRWPDPKPSIRRSSLLGRIAEEQENMEWISDMFPSIMADEEDLPPPLDKL
ncbi:MAG: DUF2971 domain-containing protein [Verrucomicrobiota bacterium]|jgi:hypothetical protein